MTVRRVQPGRSRRGMHSGRCTLGQEEVNWVADAANATSGSGREQSGAAIAENQRKERRESNKKKREGTYTDGRIIC
jgi:hypothetical protein